MVDDPEFPVYEPPPSGRVRWIACLLLAVFLCGTVSVPAAGAVWWWRQRQADRLPGPVSVPEATETGNSPPLVAAGAAVNRIAFIDLDSQLGLVAPDGSGRHMLTASRQFFQFPAWSPDGSHLAVIAGDEEGASVLVFNAQTTAEDEPEELYRSSREAPFYLFWSPDGRQVSFLANHQEDGIALHLGRVGAGASHLLTTGQPLYWDWTDGGDRLLIHTGFSGEQARLALVDAAGDGSGANIAEPGYFQAPGISASGLYQSYAEVDGDEERLLVVEDNEGNQRVTAPHQGIVAMSWSPAEDRLAYIAPPLDTEVFFGPLRLLDAPTGNSQVIADDIVLAFFWSPDGQQIAYFTIHGQDDDAIQASASVERGRTGKAQEDLLLDLWLVDVDTLQSFRLATFEPSRLWISQFLPFFDQYALSHSIWSPDSRALVLPMLNDDGRPGIYVVSADDGQREFLTDGVIGFWSKQ